MRQILIYYRPIWSIHCSTKIVVKSVGVYFLERKLPIFLQAMNRIDLVRQLPCTSKVLIIRVKKHE